MRSLLATVGIALFILAAPVLAQTGGQHWVGTWATAPVSLPPPDSTARQGPQAPARVNGQTLRQIVHTSIVGSRARVLVANTFGTAPLRVGAAHLALRDDAATLVEGSGHTLTFGGATSVTIEAGSVVSSDPVDLDVDPLVDLAVDLYLPDDSWASTATTHDTGLQTNYISTKGNHVGASDLLVETTIQNWLFLSRIDVWTDVGVGAIVAFGDSITDGTASTPDTNSRWPDTLARRLAAAHGDSAPGVLNLGISGNRILSDNPGLAALLRRGAPPDPNEPPVDPDAFFGPRALDRLDRDMLLQPGVTHVIVLESINDIGMAFESPTPTTDEIIAGHRALIQRAHARGLTIYGATLTPFRGAFYFTEIGETKRQTVNEWIRTSGAYDAVIDFDAAVRDPQHPSVLRPDYNPGDSLHMSDTGYRAMGEAIDLALFDADTRRTAADPLRTPWGAPALGGIWDFRTVTPLERPAALEGKAVFTDEEAAAVAARTVENLNADRRNSNARLDVERAYNDFWWDWGTTLTDDNRTSLIVEPPDGRIPDTTADAKALARSRRGTRPVRARVVIGSPANGPEDLGLSERCLLGFNAGPPMLPSAYNNNVQIFQTPDHVVLLNEMIHDARIVPIDTDADLPDHLRQWMGVSRGRWEGDTLVVDSTLFTDKTGSFNPIVGAVGDGSTLHLVERFTRVDADTVVYEFTVNDPETFTRPFTAAIPMKASDGPLFEYACHEGNYGMTNLLTGARVQERDAEATGGVQ